MPISVTLTVTKGRAKSKQFRYERSETLTLGRQKDCDIILSDDTVSRRHCRLDIAPPSVMVYDLGSLNGTRLNGKKVSRYPTEESGKRQLSGVSVKSGDILGVGDQCEIRIDIAIPSYCAVCYQEVPSVEYQDENGLPLCADCHAGKGQNIPGPVGNAKQEITGLYDEMAEIDGLEDAYQFIAHDFSIRSSGEELKKLLKQKGMDEASFRKAMGRENAANVGNWLKSKSIKRKSALKILLTLNVDNIAEAERFILRSCGEESDAFYARNYKDVIYMFCLKHKRGVAEAERLIQKYEFLDKTNTEAQDFNKRGTLTGDLENKFHGLRTEEDLDAFFNENADYFGKFNRTAYKIFMEYYDCAVADIERWKAEMTQEKYNHKDASVEDICDEIKSIPDKQIAALNLIQEIIAKDEPDRKRLTNVKNKKEKIPRKYLILFFMLTSANEEDYKESIEELNEVLDQCGMPRLDSRNPFDWIVMNSLYVSTKNDYDGALDRMKEIAEKIFAV